MFRFASSARRAVSFAATTEVVLPVSAEQFKLALRSWPSGVTIVTTRHGERIHGMTVSAFCSVSLDPPLILVCADNSSDTRGLILESGVFAVHILAAGQEAMSNKFASKKEEHLRFHGIEWRAGITGAPILPDVAAVLECRLSATHQAGDHVIFIGALESVHTTEHAPLVYHASGYRALAANGG